MYLRLLCFQTFPFLLHTEREYTKPISPGYMKERDFYDPRAALIGLHTYSISTRLPSSWPETLPWILLVSVTKPNMLHQELMSAANRREGASNCHTGAASRLISTPAQNCWIVPTLLFICMMSNHCICSRLVSFIIYCPGHVLCLWNLLEHSSFPI